MGIVKGVLIILLAGWVILATIATLPLENSRNMRRRKNNATGIPGVIMHCQNGRYVAQIGIMGKTKHLGITPDFFEACCLRKSAENRYGFNEDHGSNRFISSN